VAKYIGGIMETPKTIEEDGPVYELVSKQQQKEAVNFLNKQVFATPSWLINQDIFSRTGLSGLSVIGGIQDNALNRILSFRTLNKLVDADAAIGNNAYHITELLSDLKKGIWSELPTRKPITIYRRNLQKSYVNVLGNLLNSPAVSGDAAGSIVVLGIAPADKSDVTSIVRAHLNTLKNEVAAAANGTTDLMSKYHLLDIAKRIDRILDPKN
jgi:hypothetical protein